MMRAIAILLMSGALHGAITNVNMRGASATQGLLAYTAPNLTACTLEVSEDPSYSPLVHDVDTSLFASSNSDARAGNSTTGRSRIFVIGHRGKAERASNGFMYSRALQSNTPHYYRITCGGDTATGIFTTANLAIGNTYNEPMPADPSVASRPYYATMGSYAWPEFTTWDLTDPAARPETVIDPQRGVALKRMGMPGDRVLGFLPGTGTHTFTDVRGSGWTITGSAPTWNATFAGAGSNFLTLQDAALNLTADSDHILGTNMASSQLPLDYVTLTLTGKCTGACAGANNNIQACLTVNGVSCWPTNATATIIDKALTTSTSTVSIGTTTAVLSAWKPAGFQPLTKADVSARSGHADVDVAGIMTWVTSGNNVGTYFYPNWVAGSKITVGGQVCDVVSISSTKVMAIDPASCGGLSLPATNAAWSANNFGFLARKKTSSLDQITLSAQSYETGSSFNMEWNASGSAGLCSNTLIQNAVTMGFGFHCYNVVNAIPMLYWINRSTGDANYLGIPFATLSGADGTDKGCAGNNTLTGASPETFYCVQDDNEMPAKRVVFLGTVTTTSEPGSLSVSLTNLTPGSTGKDLNTLVASFTASSTHVFDPLYVCSAAGLQGPTRLTISCTKSAQDTLGWVIVFDPTLIGSAAGCVGGGAPGCVIAAMSSWATAPARWCTTHTLFDTGDTSLVWTAGKFFTPYTPPKLADGNYTSTLVTGTLSASPTIPAGTGACPGGSAGCDAITVDGEPCDETPATGEAATSPCPKNSSFVFLQNSAVGDYFSVASEITRMVAKSGNSWTMQRGLQGTDVVNHSGTPDLNAYCPANGLVQGSTNWSWVWDTAGDPHGLATTVAFDYDHPVPRTDVTVGAYPSYASGCQTGGGTCYGVRDNTGTIGDPPNRLVALGPAFAGTFGPSLFVERAQDHPSYLQDVALPSQRRWFNDGRPLTTNIDLSDAATKISGQLFRLTSTTSDGDNLFRPGYNIYVTKTSSTTIVVAGLCSTASPCPIWIESGGPTVIEEITTPCTITVVSGSGSAFISRIAAGGLSVAATAGLSLTADTCSVTVGSGYPTGSVPLWAWGSTSGAWASSGTDQRGGLSGEIGVLNRKIEPTWISCGTQPMNDISSSTLGDVISDTNADAYNYCVARKAGECRTASAAGDIYANCPNMAKRLDGSYGCQYYADVQDTAVDVCVGNNSAYLNEITQMGFGHNDFTGGLGRSLTAGLGYYKINYSYMHGKALPDASWIMLPSLWTGGSWSEILLAKAPYFPPETSLSRGRFVPLPVTLKPPTGLGVDNVIVQFGYAENGATGSFFCTSRQEACLANAATVPTVPFVFPSEGSGGVESGVAGLSCGSGCTVAIPAISQRVTYYRVKYRDASNNTLATGQVQLVMVP